MGSLSLESHGCGPSTEADDPFLLECSSKDEDEYDRVDRFQRLKRREWTKEEWLLYSRALKESEGFDVPDLPSNGYAGMLVRIPDSDLSYFGNLPELAEVGIKHYNSNNGTNFELVEIEKACMRVVTGAIFYLTLKVRPAGMPAHSPTTCLQAKVRHRLGQIETMLSRIKSDFLCAKHPPSPPRAKLRFRWAKLRSQSTKLRFSRLSLTGKLRFKKKRSTIKPRGAFSRTSPRGCCS